jgi:hypothetical protein
MRHSEDIRRVHVAVHDCLRSEPHSNPGVFLTHDGNGGTTMPVIFLWAGIPILLVGGGFVIYRIIGA